VLVNQEALTIKSSHAIICYLNQSNTDDFIQKR